MLVLCWVSYRCLKNGQEREEVNELFKSCDLNEHDVCRLLFWRNGEGRGPGERRMEEIGTRRTLEGLSAGVRCVTDVVTDRSGLIGAIQSVICFHGNFFFATCVIPLVVEQ